ncbi:MAG: sporulation protein YabP [Clostridiales bacterium]|nr:sporulation protein YabP [Clostridiales bacterium]
MAYEEKYKKTELPHSLSLQDRRKLTVSGVEDVESFDENAVVLQTCGGLLILRGSALHIDKLSIEGGELLVTGRIDSMVYEDNAASRGGFFSRLFK